VVGGEPGGILGEHLAVFDVRGQYQPGRILENGDQMPGAKWFGGAKLNFAENLLRGEPDKVALIEQREDGRGGS